MAIGGHNLTIDGKQSNPGTLNAWLRKHGGYVSGNNMAEGVVPKVRHCLVFCFIDSARCHVEFPNWRFPLVFHRISSQINPSHISWPADGMHRTNDLPISKIQEFLKAGRPVIANVMKGAHFVLVIGWDVDNSDTLYINDPGFNRDTYSYSADVVGWRLFDMKFN